MRNESESVHEMEQDPLLRRDLFSISQAVASTGISRAMILKLEKAGFLVPKYKNELTGYRFYDTFNIHKILEYKRLRLIGLSQSEIFQYFSAAKEDELLSILNTLRLRRQLLSDDIEKLSQRLEKEKNQHSFSFHDYEKTLCLIYEGDFQKPEDLMTVCYNHSVEIVSRGLRTSVTESIFYLELIPKEKNGVTLRHVKVCFPIDPDTSKGADLSGTEWIPESHNFSVLSYGLGSPIHARELLLDKIRQLNLTPLSATTRTDILMAPYVNMRISPDDFLFRSSIPVLEQQQDGI